MGMPEAIFLTSSIWTLVAGLAIVVLNPWRFINWSYFVAAGLSALWLFGISMTIRLGHGVAEPPLTAILFWLRMCSAVAAFLPWAYFLIKESTLQTNSAAFVMRRSLPWLAASCALVLLAFSETFYASVVSDNGYYKRGLGYPFYLCALAILFSLILWDALQSSRKCQGIARIEMTFFVINFGLATLVIVLIFTLSGVLQIPWLRYLGAIVTSASLSLTIWAVCYHRVFDATQILLGTVQRLLLLGLLGTGAAGLAVVSEHVIQPPYGMVLATILACLLAVHLDHPTKKWLGIDPAHVLHRARQNIIEWTRQETDEERLKSHFAQFLTEWCHAESAVLLARKSDCFAAPSLSLPLDWAGLEYLSKEGWTTPEALHRQRESPGTSTCLDFMLQNRLGALLAVPRGSSSPSLLVILGHKHNRRPYTFPDIRMILELAELMDNILTHSRVAARTTQIKKMESAAMMSRGLAHDLNNLATPVASFLLHMEPRVQAGTPEAEVLADAKHSIRVMQDYIRESLFFTRQLSPDFRTAVARELMESVLTLTQARATARGVTVAVSAPPDIHFVADSALIRRLLQNLVFNGIDATARGGVVTLSAAVDTDSVRFSVADEGAGIPPAIMDRIFEPYFTTKDTGDNVRGLGLGLAICRKICDLHGGDITVSSAPGRGSTFTVILPIAPRPSPARDAKPAVAGVNPARHVVPQTPAVRPATS